MPARSLGTVGEFGRGLVCAGDDLLLSLVEDARNVSRARSERFGALAHAVGDLAVGRIEDTPELDRPPGN